MSYKATEGYKFADHADLQEGHFVDEGNVNVDLADVEALACCNTEFNLFHDAGVERKIDGSPLLDLCTECRQYSRCTRRRVFVEQRPAGAVCR